MSEEVIQQVVEQTLKAQKYRNGAWLKVIDEGRKYAMMKATGKYIERDSVISVGLSDRESYIEMFRNNLLHAVEDAFVEDALLGISIPTNNGN